MVDHRFALKKIQSLKEVIVLCFQPTKMPYIECDPETYDDQVHIFGNEEEAQEFIKSYKEKKIALAAMKVLQKQAPLVLTSLYAYGVNALVFHDNHMITRLQMEQVVRKPEFEKAFNGKVPAANPSLQLSALYFLEELRRPVEHDMKQLKELEEEMVANLVRSRFILASKAANADEPFRPDDPNQAKVINYIKDKEGQIFLPVFTDVSEFQKFYREKAKGMGMLVMKFHHLQKHLQKDVKAIILNPAGFHLQIVPEQLDKIIKDYPLEDAQENK